VTKVSIYVAADKYAMRTEVSFVAACWKSPPSTLVKTQPMRSPRDARRHEVDRLKWCERPVLLKVLVHAFDQVEQTHTARSRSSSSPARNRIRAWLERVSPRV